MMPLNFVSSNRPPVSLPLEPARLLPLVLLAVLCALPWLGSALDLGYYVGFVRRMLIVGIAALGLNFLLGYGGLAALGHAGFIGVGAYTVVALVDAGLASAWIAWGAALLVSGLVAALIGLLCLRTHGVYFLMITLAFAQMLYYLMVSLSRYGGDDGYGLYSPLSLGGGWTTADAPVFFWVVLAIATLAFLLVSRAADSRFGHALMGIRDNETRMIALGYPVFRIKLVAFAGAGALAGLAGALLASHNNFVSPSMMHWTESATLLVMVVIGGLGRRWGAPAGVALWLVLSEVLKLNTEYWHWPLGLVLIAIVFLAPQGVAGLFERRRGAA